MTIWHVVVFFLVLFAFLELCAARQPAGIVRSFPLERIAYVYMAGVLVFLSAFSFEIGKDWGGYVNMYNNSEALLQTGSIERGYIAVNLLFKRLGIGFWEMYACMRMFCTIVFFSFFFKNSSCPLYTLAIWFFLSYFASALAQTRQFIATAILICGTGFIQKRRLLFWVLTVLVAMQFHISSLLALPVYFTTRIKIRPWLCFALLALFIWIQWFGVNLAWRIADISLMLPLPERITRLVITYTTSSRHNQVIEYEGIRGFGFWVKCIFCFIVAFLYYVKCKNKEPTDGYFMLNFFIDALVTGLGRNLPIFGRLASYYNVVGGGIFAWNVIPDSARFFKGADMARVVFAFAYVVARALDFFIKQHGEENNAYFVAWKTFLF